MLSAADLERQMMLGAGAGAGTTGGGASYNDADDEDDWKQLPEDQIEELRMVLARLKYYAPPAASTSAPPGGTNGDGSDVDGEWSKGAYGVSLEELLRMLAAAEVSAAEMDLLTVEDYVGAFLLLLLLLLIIIMSQRSQLIVLSGDLFISSRQAADQ
jgi:hypothetical protein